MPTKTSSTEIEYYLPNYSFEFIDGCSLEQIGLLSSALKKEYSKKINQEIDLVEIPSCFAYHLIDVPFIGFIWLRKVRKAHYKTSVPASKRNFIMPVGRSIAIQINPPDIDTVFINAMKAISPKTRWTDTSIFSKKMKNLYCNIYAMSYYKRMELIETNELRQRVWKFRASYNNKLIWRWDYGATFWGLKPKTGHSIITSI